MGKIGQLDTRRFLKALRQVGRVPEAWHRYIGPCPKHVGAGGNQDPLEINGCTLCGGTGDLYEEMTLPLDGPSRGKVMTLQATQRNKRTPAEIEAGDVVCSFLENDYPLAEGDRLRLSTRLSTHSQRLKRASSGLADFLKYIPAVEVEAVFTEAGKITTGFDLNSAGTQLVWTPDAAPARGAYYTVRYRYRQTYVVRQGSIHHREEADNGDLFPSRCILQLWRNGHLDVKQGQ